MNCPIFYAKLAEPEQLATGAIVTLEACLPAHLRGPQTTISKIAAGLSGAGVYRVEAAGQTYVLKVSAQDEPLAVWRRKLHIKQLVATAGVAPAVIHADESQRAVLSTFIVDRSFFAFFGNPATREAALAQLGQTLRRVHDLPTPEETDTKAPLDFLATVWSAVPSGFRAPAFVSEAVERISTEQAPPRERPIVFSHNDVNPTNLVFDGEKIMLLDWETAGANDPFYDLAAIAVFLRMDNDTCLKVLAAYDGKVSSGLSARFVYNQRLVAVLCGSVFLHLAWQQGSTSFDEQQTLASTLSLADIYQRLRAGTINIASAEGQWLFGLALIKASFGFC